jgi:hypothetical protein
LAPTLPYFDFQQSPGPPPGAVPTCSRPRGMTTTFDLRSVANSSVRAKMTDPSLGLIVIPVHANAAAGTSTETASIANIAVRGRIRVTVVTPVVFRDSKSRSRLPKR